MGAVNNGARAVQMQSPGAAAYRAVLAAQWMADGCNTVHGPPLQARVVAANGTVLAACKLLLAILAHMDMNRWGKSKAK